MHVTTTIWTVKQLFDSGHAVAKWCPVCRKSLPKLDLAGLVEAGYGDKPPRDLPLKCPKCKGRVLITIHPPYAGGIASRPGDQA